MSTLDDLMAESGVNVTKGNGRPKPPANISPGHLEFDGQSGTYTTRGSAAPVPPSHAEVFAEMGKDPETHRIVGPWRESAWDAWGPDGDVVRMRSWRVHFEAVGDEDSISVPLGEAFKLLVQKAKAPFKIKRVGREKRIALIICLGDVQVGKIGSRGSTEELLLRLGDGFASIEGLIKHVRPDLIVIVDNGDVIEGFDSAGGNYSQATRTDRSLMEQIEIARNILHRLVSMAARYAEEVMVAGVPSNHCAWRSGKANLGKPSDDWGIHNIKALASLYADNANLAHVRFYVPEDQRESLVINVLGTKIALVHGHQARKPEMVGEWWGKQMIGGNLFDADILIHGHFHTYGTYAYGRNPFTGRQRWVIGVTTTDNGSDWYVNLAGSDSDPGITTLIVEEGTGLVEQKVLWLGGEQ